MWMTRPCPQRYDRWHPYGHGSPIAHGLRSGGAVRLMMAPRAFVELGQPAGPVVQPGRNIPYTGMDPSDPTTYVRRYNPAPGMIAYLNFDGAVPNATQTVANPPRSWKYRPRRRKP